MSEDTASAGAGGCAFGDQRALTRSVLRTACDTARWGPTSWVWIFTPTHLWMFNPNFPARVYLTAAYRREHAHRHHGMHIVSPAHSHSQQHSLHSAASPALPSFSAICFPQTVCALSSSKLPPFLMSFDLMIIRFDR